ncbi:hypothetical protein ACFQ3R_06210 [Mesonia ostreae]|uniref:EpsG family protein n=1 Tax=Mesonia ostreae TaxID=861110 RepID=A0ABU2KH85_9FLAO|nr:hypothetical protein [Mesonia ostreae]MDT0294066.1 hypothetical protein [Mesonia ostreae]
MNNQSKAYAIILYLIWPFSALWLGIKYFDFKFGKNLLIALFGFLGFTALSHGDLERYEASFYDLTGKDFSLIVADLFSLQTGKFYNDFLSVVVGIFSNSHHVYFMLLFLIYGYFLVGSISSFKSLKIKQHSRYGLLLFIAFALYYSVFNILNLAFYTGGIFVIYSLIKYYNTQQKKYLYFIFLAPLFHLGLSLFVVVPLFVLVFKNKLLYYVIFLLFTFGLGQSNFVEVIENIASSNSGTIIESKYKVYASEKGRERMEKRYELGEQNANIKLKTLFFFKDGIHYVLVPLGLVLLYFKRKTILYKYDLIRLFNLVLLTWGISNLMLNISQGERFLNIYCFLAIGLFYNVYVKTRGEITNTWLNKYLHVLMPTVLLTGFMTLLASHFMVSFIFFTSNFFIEIYKMAFALN